MFDRGLEHTLGTSFWKCKPKDINIHCTNGVYEAYFFKLQIFLIIVARWRTRATKPLLQALFFLKSK